MSEINQERDISNADTEHEYNVFTKTHSGKIVFLFRGTFYEICDRMDDDRFGYDNVFVSTKSLENITDWTDRPQTPVTIDDLAHMAEQYAKIKRSLV